MRVEIEACDFSLQPAIESGMQPNIYILTAYDELTLHVPCGWCMRLFVSIVDKIFMLCGSLHLSVFTTVSWMIVMMLSWC